MPIAVSIHKSQGSEFPIVILPIVKGYHRMLRRNLIYTAVTRSKDYLILCGDKEAFEYAIEHNDVGKRHSNLARKLRERLAVSSAGLTENESRAATPNEKSESRQMQ
ncbi:ATP-binding domain-containing protein [Terrilactibacillus sp. S3-3]|nr:ATP-binding domain-containing protein [Terrilactibacillus sp. S3-3]